MLYHWKRLFLPLAMGVSFAAATSMLAQEPINEDEWYDPSDWFDGNNYEYDDTLGLDYSYYDDEIGDLASDWDYDWAYEPGDFDYGMWDDYDGYAYYDDLYDEGDEWFEDENGLYEDDDDLLAEDDGLYEDDGWFEDDYDFYDNDVGEAPEYEEGYDWGFNRGYGTRSGWTQGQDQRQRASMRRGAGNQKQVSGTLERFRTLTLDNSQGRSRRFTVAQVELNDGRDVLVAFDPGRSINLNEGNQFQAKGTVGRINGRRVLMADMIRTSGQRYNVSPASLQRAQGSSMRPRRARVEGSRKARTSEGENTFLLLRFEDGTTAIVDLGPETIFDQLQRSTSSNSGQRYNYGNYTYGYEYPGQGSVSSERTRTMTGTITDLDTRDNSITVENWAGYNWHFEVPRASENLSQLRRGQEVRVDFAFENGDWTAYNIQPQRQRQRQASRE